MKPTLPAFSALTGQLISNYPISQPDEIAQTLHTAQQAAKLWGQLGTAQRGKRLAKLEAVILSKLDTITDTLVMVTGEVKTEVLLGEIYPVLALLRYYQKNAARILAPCPIHTAPMAFLNAEAGYERRPYGVVAVIAPWNFPCLLYTSPSPRD